MITIDGAAGTLMLGALPLVAAELGDDFDAIATWADERRRLRVRANADTPEDARRARELGAEGIGLCRTEHMFMAAERLPVVREMILATQDARREEALAKLLPMQQSDFEAIFAAMAGLPVTVRLLDPPLHEFLPDRTALAVELALARARARARPPRAARRPRARALGAEPDARHARLPARTAAPGHLRDAGARDRARRPRGGGARRGGRRSRS